MNDPIIRVKGLHRLYKRGPNAVEALRGIDLDIPKGKSVLIVGPSGAGKSTLLQIMGGLISPTVGKVYFEAADLYSLSENLLAKIRNT